MIKGINHLGIAVNNIDDTLAFLQAAFGAEEISRTEFPEMKQVSSIVALGDGKLELMEPTAPDGVVGRFLETKGGGLHHISLLCDDIKETCQELEGMGLQIIGKMLEGPVKVAFIHPKSAKGLLFEIAQND